MGEILQMKRNIYFSLIEILCPVLLLFFYFIIRCLFIRKKEKYTSLYNNDLEFILKYSTNLTNLVNSQQGNEEEININMPIPYYHFLTQCIAARHIALIGKDFPQKIIDKISEHFWELDDINIDENDFFVKYNNIEEFNKYIQSKDYGKNEILYPKICFGISQIDKFKFNIHYGTIEKEKPNDLEKYLYQLSPIIPDMKSNKNEKIRTQGNLQFFENYKNSGYLMVMKIIYDYILQEITNDPEAEINFTTLLMKYDEIKKDDFHNYLHILGFFILISYSIPFAINIYKEIHFKEIKKKEYLKSMGVKEIIFFLSFFIRTFIINIFHSIFCALFVNLVLKESQYIYFLVIFILYGLIIFSMTYFFQSFLQVSRMGVIISLIIYCIMGFFYLPIKSPATNKVFVYFLCIFFPPCNLLLGFNTFYVFERQFSPLDNRINLDISTLKINLMLVFMFLNILIYLLFGYIISQLISSYEINNKCRCSKKRRNYSRISNPPKTGGNNNNDIQGSNIYNTNINNVNNININIQIGENYMDDDISFKEEGKEEGKKKEKEKEKKKIEKKKIEKQIQSLASDYVKGISKKLPEDIIKIKREKLTKSIMKFEEYNTENKEEKLDDQCENDLNNQVELQQIKDKRRLFESTMYNLTPEGKDKNKNLELSQIKYMVENNVVNDSEGKLGKDNSIKRKSSKKSGNSKESNTFKTFSSEEDLHTGSRLEIKNIYKKYENAKEYALNDFSLNLYQNEICALLGQNGAGKSTLISILSGLIDFNKGNIIYKKLGDNIGIKLENPEENIKFRKILGVCHQNNNILYDDLTVRENLEVFCLYKYDKNSHNNGEFYNDDIKKEIEDLLRDFELKNEENTLSKNLSGGLKRRLCIAIAFCGRSEVIILDEPTGGIDILNRKKLWTILKNLKNKGKIILLVTHFMEEATFLADNIGILKNGKILCQGSNRELIDKYGKYITIKINKKFKKKELKNFKEKINDYIKKSENSIDSGFIKEDFSSSHSLGINSLDSSLNEKIEFIEYKERIVIKIPVKKFDFSKANKFLDSLEKEFDIKEYSILRDQLEDAFIKMIQQGTNKNDDEDYKTLTEIDKNIPFYNKKEKFIKDLKILIFKRGYETLRDKKSFILEILFPIILVIIACLVSYIEVFEENKTVPIELNNLVKEKYKQAIYYNFLNNEEYDNVAHLVFEDEKKKLKKYFNLQPIKQSYGNSSLTSLQNITIFLNAIYENQKKNSTYNPANFFIINSDSQIHKYEFVSFINAKQKHATIAYNNHMLKNLINYQIKKSGESHKYPIDDISLINSPFKLTYEEKKNKKSRNGFMLVFFISIALSLIPSNFITIIIREKENKSKHLQLLSGLSIYIYWINNYIFELLKYYVVVGICFIILAIFDFYEKYLIIFYIFYGPALISFTYVVSYFIEHEGWGQVIILLINLIFGALGGSAIFIFRINKSAKYLGIALSYIFRLVPSFCICYGYNQLISKNALLAIDYFKTNHVIDQVMEKYNNHSWIINDGKYIINDIIFLILEIFLYTGLLIFLEQKDFFLWKFGFNKQDSNYHNREPSSYYLTNPKIPKDGSSSRDSKEEKEKQKINLLVNNLRKNYQEKKNNCGFIFCKNEKRKEVLSDVTFSVKNGHCFGLLGSNGQGKTTAFKCLCKEIRPDSGKIKINNIDIFNFENKENPRIGYCPQFDSIFEYLTVEQNLKFYGILRGIRENSLEKIIKIIIEKLDLSNHRDKLSVQLSGGNKRKLSVGISLISKPWIILMDEPSTGMDPYTRSLLMQFLHRAYLKNYNNRNSNHNNNIEKHKTRAIVLTTHSIEEAEALCNKIGILVNGKFSKEGTISNILQKASKGIELNIEFKKPKKEDLINTHGNILGEELNSKEEIKDFLYHKGKAIYSFYLQPDHFGKDILKVLKLKKKINKFTILRWMEYLNLLMGLVDQIKNYFNSVTCIKYKLNNFILKIRNNKVEDKNAQVSQREVNDNRIFGIIEENKEKFCIEEYSYSLTTLETIFQECYEKEDDNRNDSKKGKKAVSIEL